MATKLIYCPGLSTTAVNYRGILIEESLEDRGVLNRLKIIETKISQVTPRHKTPWLKQWTLDTVEIDEALIESVSKTISLAIDREHRGSWFADFLNDKNHYVIFYNKVFLIDRRNKSNYDEAVKYGLSIGIPAHQLDFSDDLIS